VTTNAPPFPGIYQGKRRRRAWPWVLAAIIVIVLAAGGAVAFKVIKDRRAGPSRQEIQSTILASSSKYETGVRTVTCVMPATWASGQGFTCFAYGISGRQLAQISGTVLPTEGSVPEWNEEWIATSGTLTPSRRTPATTNTGATGATGATGNTGNSGNS